MAVYVDSDYVYSKSGLKIYFNSCECGKAVAVGYVYHSGCLDSKNILSTIDPPPGVPGVSKNHIFFSTNESVFLLR